MANIVNTQLILDGPRNCVVKVDGILDTSDLAATIIVDPTVLAGMDNTGTIKAATTIIQRIQFAIEDGLELRLSWGTAPNVPIVELTGRGTEKFEHFGGLWNNSAAGSNGHIRVASEGWSAGKILSFTLILTLKKQGRLA